MTKWKRLKMVWRFVLKPVLLFVWSGKNSFYVHFGPAQRFEPIPFYMAHKKDDETPATYTEGSA